VASTAAGWLADFLSVNVNKAPFNNPLVVQAVEDAINRKQLVSQLGFGVATASVQPFPTTSPAYNPSLNSVYTYDPAKAKQLLAKAGFKPGQITVPLDLVSSLNTGGPELIQQQLKAVGINVTIVPQTITAFYAGYYGKTDQLAFYGYVGRDSKVEALNEHYGSSGILNLSAPRETAAFAAAEKKLLAIPITASGYESALQNLTKVGVETGSTITVLTEPNAYVTTKAFSGFPLIDGVFRWNGVTVK